MEIIAALHREATLGKKLRYRDGIKRDYRDFLALGNLSLKSAEKTPPTLCIRNTKTMRVVV